MKRDVTEHGGIGSPALQHDRDRIGADRDAVVEIELPVDAGLLDPPAWLRSGSFTLIEKWPTGPIFPVMAISLPGLHTAGAEK